MKLEVWPEQHHVFQATPFHEVASRAIEEIGTWVRNLA